MTRTVLPWLGAAGLMLAAGGCSVQVGEGGPRSEPGKTVQETKTVERSKTEMVQVSVEMGAGELKLQGGSKRLLDADFAFNVPAFKPEVRYDASDFRSKLTIRHGSASTSFGDIENNWSLKLADDIPMELAVRCGAGESNLDLRTMTIRNVEVRMGAGKVDMRLPAKPEKGFNVQVHGGVGEAIVHYPREAGVVAEASGGLGEIEVEGLSKDGNRYVNDSYGKSKVTIRLEVKGGIGKIHLLPL